MIKEGQNIFDICLEKFGGLEHVFEVINPNKLKFNYNLQGGQELNIDNFGKGNKPIKDYYNRKNIVPVNYMNAVIAAETTNSPYTADTTNITADTTQITADATGATKTEYTYNSDIFPNYFVIFVQIKSQIVEDDQVKEGQNIFDITLQRYGDLEFIFEVLSNNNLNLNSDLQGGQQLNISNFAIGNEEIKDYYKRKSIKPANQWQQSA